MTAMRRCLASVAALVAATAGATAPDDDWARERERFELWTYCSPMNLVVEGLPTSAADIGLTRESIEVAVRSRLRSARVYDEDSRRYLYVNVNVFGSAFGVNVEFKRLVRAIDSELRGFAPTWDVGSVGTHGNDPSYVRTAVSEDVDRFLDAYLRVNEAACAQRAQGPD